MSMSCSLSCSLRQTQTLAQSLRLSQGQRLALQQKQLGLRLGLVEALREERYEPKGQCPSCSRELTAVEIINGFNKDPNDFTTRCSACGKRFEPTLLYCGRGVSFQMPFYCDSQTLARLPGLETMSPDQLAVKRPSVYRSCIVHHGSLKKAFGEINIDYPFEEITDWRDKIKAFLGKLPDTVIAGCASVSTATIAGMGA